MRRKRIHLILGLTTAIAGCSAHAGEERRGADEPGELRVRLDKETVQAILAPPRQVQVSGMAKVSAEPDVADIWVGVTVSRPTALEAVTENNQAMTALIEAIKRRGVAARDIRTSHVSISPQYSRPVDAKPDVPPELTVSKVVGYEVSNNLQVTARDLSKIGELLDSATANELGEFVDESCLSGTTVNTDEWNGYNRVAGRHDRVHVTVDHSGPRSTWAIDADGDGVREVHCNTMEGTWTGLRNFPRPFRGVSKGCMSQYVAMFEWSNNIKEVTDEFLKFMLGMGPNTEFAS